MGDDALKMMAGMGVIRTEQAAQVMSEVKSRAGVPSFWRRQLREAYLKQGKRIPVFFDEQTTGFSIPIPDELGEMIETSVRRIAKGILFKFQPGFDSREHDFHVVTKAENEAHEVTAAVEAMGPLPAVVTVGPPGYFFAAWGFAKDDPDSGVMLQNYYGGLNFFVFISRKGADWLLASNVASD